MNECGEGALDDGAHVDRFHWLSHVIKHSNTVKSIYLRTRRSEDRTKAEKRRKRKGASGKCASIGPRCCQVTHWLSQQSCKTSSCGCVSIVNDSPGNVLLFSAVNDWVSGSESVDRALRYLEKYFKRITAQTGQRDERAWFASMERWSLATPLGGQKTIPEWIN